MSDKRDLFAPRSAEDVKRLVAAQPLAWIVSGGGDAGFNATLLPLRPMEEDGNLLGFMGHFARGNAHLAALRADPRALILFLGVNGYISPSWMADRTQAPTWNYASAQFAAEIEFFEDPAEIRAHLDDLVGAMEAGRERAWSIPEMGARYEMLASRIVGFRAHIKDTRARFKLGQDERPDVLADILNGLDAGGHRELAAWMRGFNPGRA